MNCQHVFFEGKGLGRQPRLTLPMEFLDYRTIGIYLSICICMFLSVCCCFMLFFVEEAPKPLCVSTCSKQALWDFVTKRLTRLANPDTSWCTAPIDAPGTIGAIVQSLRLQPCLHQSSGWFWLMKPLLWICANQWVWIHQWIKNKNLSWLINPRAPTISSEAG